MDLLLVRIVVVVVVEEASDKKMLMVAFQPEMRSPRQIQVGALTAAVDYTFEYA